MIVSERLKILSASLILVTAFLMSCTSSPSVRLGYIAQDKESAKQAIEVFHSQMNAGDVDRIYKGASEPFRKSQDKDTLAREMQATRSRFGKFERVESSELKVILGSPVQIRAVCKSTFEKGNATELFVFVKDQVEVRLASYQIWQDSDNNR